MFCVLLQMTAVHSDKYRYTQMSCFTVGLGFHSAKGCGQTAAIYWAMSTTLTLKTVVNEQTNQHPIAFTELGIKNIQIWNWMMTDEVLVWNSVKTIYNIWFSWRQVLPSIIWFSGTQNGLHFWYKLTKAVLKRDYQMNGWRKNIMGQTIQN